MNVAGRDLLRMRRNGFEAIYSLVRGWDSHTSLPVHISETKLAQLKPLYEASLDVKSKGQIERLTR